MGTSSRKVLPMHFKTMIQADVPQGRNGRHKEIVSVILKDLDRINDGSALKVPLADLADGKEKVRSALNRAENWTQRRHRLRRHFLVRLERRGVSGFGREPPLLQGGHRNQSEAAALAGLSTTSCALEFCRPSTRVPTQPRTHTRHLV